MLKKSFQVLKNNPIIILFYGVYFVIMFLILFTLYPHDLSQFSTTNLEQFNFTEYIIMMIKMLTAAGLISVLGIVFFSGFGYMISEAVRTGKTSKNSLLQGIKKFILRTLVAALLLFTMTMGVSIIMSIITIPITMWQVFTGGYSSVQYLSILITAITAVITIFLIPFILLWFPSIFMDDTKVIQALKSGAKAGVKNYWKLVLTLLVIYLPTGLIMGFNYGSIVNGSIFTPCFLVMYLIDAIISIFIIVLLFVIYEEYRVKNMPYYGQM